MNTPSHLVPKGAIIPLIVAAALFMEHLDGSIITTALPDIAHSLNTGVLRLNLAITSYLFGLALFIPLSGWMADQMGSRTVFRAAILIFTLSSAACGFADTLPTLIAARFVQGMAGAMMVPVGRLVIMRSVPRHELVGALSWLAAPALIGPVVGPPLGGFIVTHFSWRWIFFINVPIGLLGIYLTNRAIPQIKEPSDDPLDIKGFIWVALGLVGIVVASETVGRGLIPGSAVAGSFAVGLFGLRRYARHAKTATAPIVDLTLFRLPTFFLSNVGGSFFRIGIGALPFLLPLLFQVGFGLSALQSGLLVFSGAAGAVLMKLFAPLLIKKYGFRSVLIPISVITAVFNGLIGFFTAETAHIVILGVLFMGGFFRSVQFNALNAIAYAEVEDKRMSRATTLFSMMQQLSLSFGVGLSAFLLDTTLTIKGREHLMTQDFWPTCLIIALLTLLSALFFMRMPKDAGDDMRGLAPEPAGQS